MQCQATLSFSEALLQDSTECKWAWCACVLAWEKLSLYNEPCSMLSIQLILNISNQWSRRTSFISENENDRKEASFAQWNQCGLLFLKKKKNMISLSVIFSFIYIVYSIHSQVLPPWSQERNIHSKPLVCHSKNTSGRVRSKCLHTQP